MEIPNGWDHPDGWDNGDGGNPDAARMVLHERAVLRKFDGDDQSVPPVEVLLIEDGRVTGHWTGPEVIHAPSE